MIVICIITFFISAFCSINFCSVFFVTDTNLNLDQHKKKLRQNPKIIKVFGDDPKVIFIMATDSLRYFMAKLFPKTWDKLYFPSNSLIYAVFGQQVAELVDVNDDKISFWETPETSRTKFLLFYMQIMQMLCSPKMLSLKPNVLKFFVILSFLCAVLSMLIGFILLFFF